MGHLVRTFDAKGVELLTPDEAGYRLTLSNGRELQTDAVILTTPAYITAKLVAPWNKALADAHDAIPYASTAVVTLAYEESKLAACSHH